VFELDTIIFEKLESKTAERRVIGGDGCMWSGTVTRLSDTWLSCNRTGFGGFLGESTRLDLSDLHILDGPRHFSRMSCSTNRQFFPRLRCTELTGCRRFWIFSAIDLLPFDHKWRWSRSRPLHFSSGRVLRC